MLQLKKLALSNHIIQTREYYFLLAKSIRHSLLHSKTEIQKEKKKKKINQQKREPLTEINIGLGPSGKPILSIGAQLPILQHVQEWTYWGAEKMILLSNQHYWKDSPTAVHKVYSRSSICLKHNPGKSFHISHRHFQLSLGPFEECQLYFTQMHHFKDKNMH